MKWSIGNILTKDFSKETVRVKMEQEKNSEMKKKMEEESGYHDGKIYYKKKTKGKWCNSYF